MAQHRIKNRLWAALDRAVRETGLDCEALGDGITIEAAIRLDPPGRSIDVNDVYAP